MLHGAERVAVRADAALSDDRDDALPDGTVLDVTDRATYDAPD